MITAVNIAATKAAVVATLAAAVNTRRVSCAGVIAPGYIGVCLWWFIRFFAPFR